MIEPLHDHRQSLDKLPALLRQIGGLEERPRCWINLEKPVIEQARCRVCHRRNLEPGRFHECFLFREHWKLQNNSRVWLNAGLDRWQRRDVAAGRRLGPTASNGSGDGLFDRLARRLCIGGSDSWAPDIAPIAILWF